MDSNTGISGHSEFYFQWHVTEKCNLRCSHCYQTNNSDLEMTTDELFHVADKIFKALAKWNMSGRIAITGGEPFLKRELFPLLHYLGESKQIGHIDILSNGTLIKEDHIEEIKQVGKVRRLQVSLDGATQKTHDSIRGNGSFEKALDGIRVLKKNGIKVNVMYTLQRSNIQDIHALFDLASQECFDGLTFERFVPCGSGEALKDTIFTPEETRDIFKQISDRADAEYEKGSPLVVYKYRTLWANLDPARGKLGSNTPPQLELGAICSVGLDGLCILPDGTVLPCRRLNIPIGNLKTDTVFKIWYTSDVLWNIRNKSNLKGKCKGCELIPRCSGCRAMAYAASGDYMEEDPQCWKK